MKIHRLILYVMIVVIAAPPLLLGLLSALSRRSKPPGIVDGRLAPCPKKPNCVCSEPFDDTENSVLPIRFSGTTEDALVQLREAIVAEGGAISEEATEYLAATFESRLFRFIDDVEFRIVPDESIAHVRSASRVGYSDLGANLKRVEAIAKRLELRKLSGSQDKL